MRGAFGRLSPYRASSVTDLQGWFLCLKEVIIDWLPGNDANSSGLAMTKVLLVKSDGLKEFKEERICMFFLKPSLSRHRRLK